MTPRIIEDGVEKVTANNLSTDLKINDTDLTKGDILHASANKTLSILSVGTDNQLPKVATDVLNYETLANAVTPRFLIFSVLGSQTNTTDIFSNLGGGNAGDIAATESAIYMPIDFGFRVTAFKVDILVNSRSLAVTLGFRDDGSTIGGTSISASGTGLFETLTLTDDVASGSNVDFIWGLSAGTGTLQPVSMFVECSIV